MGPAEQSVPFVNNLWLSRTVASEITFWLRAVDVAFVAITLLVVLALLVLVAAVVMVSEALVSVGPGPTEEADDWLAPHWFLLLLLMIVFIHSFRTQYTIHSI